MKTRSDEALKNAFEMLSSIEAQRRSRGNLARLRLQYHGLYAGHVEVEALLLIRCCSAHCG